MPLVIGLLILFIVHYTSGMVRGVEDSAQFTDENQNESISNSGF
jgi:hypothetical protein